MEENKYPHRPGWNHITDRLVEMAKRKGFRITDIKEKYGGLRFYTHGGDDELNEAIDAAEDESLRTCEECGKPGEPRDLSWILTLCDDHYTEAKSGKL